MDTNRSTQSDCLRNHSQQPADTLITRSRLITHYDPVSSPLILMNTHFNILPLDRTEITSEAQFNADLLSDPIQFIEAHKLEIRSSKPSRSSRNGHPVSVITLNVLTYKGIRIQIESGARRTLSRVTIHFNPSVVLYGLNGHVITLNEFLDALAILVSCLKPLFANSNDWPCLIPGLRSGGLAYWSYLEVFSHWRDIDGSQLAGYRNLRHPDLKRPPRHWPDSICAGAHKSNLLFFIYRKAVEMNAAKKLSDSELNTYKSILRLEARMKNDKLVKYFGNGSNIDVIDGVERLIWFHPKDLINGHRMAFLELKGVYKSELEIKRKDKIKPLDARGLFLVNLAADERVPYTFSELLERVIDYTGADRSGTTITAMRKAGEFELEKRSTITRDLFSDAAYHRQYSVKNTEVEKLVRHEIRTVIADRLILDTYRPAGQPFDYSYDFPNYIVP